MVSAIPYIPTATIFALYKRTDLFLFFKQKRSELGENSPTKSLLVMMLKGLSQVPVDLASYQTGSKVGKMIAHTLIYLAAVTMAKS